MSRLPHKAAAVTLAVPRRERVPATVARSGDGWIELLLEATPSTPPSVLAQGALFVEFFNEAGLCRLLGRKGAVEEREPAGGWVSGDVMRVDHDGAVQLLQARASIRAAIAAEISLTSLATGERHRTSTIDLSGSGARVMAFPDVRRGDAFEFEIELPEQAIPVSGRLRVVRVVPGSRAAVAFTDISESDQTRLDAYVVNLQTVARNARRGG
jgi:hypothetical protein